MSRICTVLLGGHSKSCFVEDASAFPQEKGLAAIYESDEESGRGERGEALYCLVSFSICFSRKTEGVFYIAYKAGESARSSPSIATCWVGKACVRDWCAEEHSSLGSVDV